MNHTTLDSLPPTKQRVDAELMLTRFLAMREILLACFFLGLLRNRLVEAGRGWEEAASEKRPLQRSAAAADGATTTVLLPSSANHKSPRQSL